MYFRGQVLGRKKLSVKICSCPRRDMLKEEEVEKKRLNGLNNYKKRIIPISNDIIPKKILKMHHDNDENTIYELPVVCSIDF